MKTEIVQDGKKLKLTHEFHDAAGARPSCAALNPVVTSASLYLSRRTEGYMIVLTMQTAMDNSIYDYMTERQAQLYSTRPGEGFRDYCIQGGSAIRVFLAATTDACIGEQPLLSSNMRDGLGAALDTVVRTGTFLPRPEPL